MNGLHGLPIAALVLLLAAPGQAAECRQDVAQTVTLMGDGRKTELEVPSGDARKKQVAQGEDVKAGAQSGDIKESWQGGTPTKDEAPGSDRPAFNPEAAGFLELATQLAEKGNSGGCRQVLVQAQRILGIIAADTPLPPTQ